MGDITKAVVTNSVIKEAMEVTTVVDTTTTKPESCGVMKLQLSHLLGDHHTRLLGRISNSGDGGGIVENLFSPSHFCFRFFVFVSLAMAELGFLLAASLLLLTTI